MLQDVLQDAFTADELARAAGVPRAAVDGLIARGDLRPIGRTGFFAGRDAIAAGRLLRVRASEAFIATPAPLFSALPDGSQFATRRGRMPAFASSFVHGAILLAILALTSGSTETAATPPPQDETRLVFLVTPGPGGGGGGGGLRNPLPAPRVERRGTQRTRVAVPAVKPEAVLASRREVEPQRRPPAPAEPKPVEKAPEPLPSQVLVAPVAEAAANDRDRAGVIEQPRGDADSQGGGIEGGAGDGRGSGNGEGLGSGIGDGSGGGTGGGPFRPGSGIEPPRLVREVKAEYTDDARRRNITGDVLLEIVVRRDGSVGDIRVRQGLGGGLDERAVDAVRRWQFTPATRKGEPVDVLVEVAVEFTLR
jgi:TonB family protein